jgi:hypothetical protein
MLKTIQSLNFGKFLLTQATAQENTDKPLETAERPVHHIFVLDCSGSMYNELGRIRADLYNKVSTSMKEGDLLTVLWFSSRNEYGILVEAYHLKSDTSLTKLKDLFEKQLYARNLTAFKDPLVETEKVIARVSALDSNIVHSLFFLTDGHDNSYSSKEIVGAMSVLKPLLASAAMVEYGYYCNRRLLNEMSVEVGGVHVFAQDFQDYEPYLKSQFDQKIRSERKKVHFGKVHGDIVFSKSGDDVIIYKVDENGDAFIDVDGGDVFFLAEKPVVHSLDWEKGKKDEIAASAEFFQDEARFIGFNRGLDGRIGGHMTDNNRSILQAAYMAMFAFSRKSDYNTISDILRVVGDAYFIRKKANTFGTQKINELEAEFLGATNDMAFMYREGYNPDLEPAEDAYCVFDMLEDLMSDEKNLWYPLDPSFSYNRIGRKAQLAAPKTSDAQKEELKKLIDENKTSQVIDKLKEIEENKPEDLKFVYKDKAQGHPIHDLVWNNTRANLSVRVRFEGTVELPKNSFDKLPKVFDTYVWRNYTLIKDGIINAYVLPVSLVQETFDKLQANGLLEGEVYHGDGHVYVLDFSSLPVINQKMIKQVKAEQLFRDQYALLKLQARNTVFNHLKKAYFDNVSISFSTQYGEDAAAWLKEIGITPNGFNPKVTLEPPTEETLVNTLSVKIEKMTLPNAKKDFEAIMTKMDKGMGLTPREALLEGAIKEFKAFEKLSDGVSDAAKKTLIETWLTEKSNEIRKEKSRLMNAISRVQFVTIVGKSWFSDLESREDKEMLLEMDGAERKFVIEDAMETIKV